MPRLLLTLFLLFLSTASPAKVVITPAEVFGQVLLVEQETELLRRHFQVTTPPRPATPVRAEIHPRHVWHKVYMVQTKLVVFRRQMGFEATTPVGVEPREHTDPSSTWAQVQRLLILYAFNI